MPREIDPARATPVVETDHEGDLMVKNGAVRFDPDAATWVYMGIAVPGADPSKPVWQIRRAHYSGANIDYWEWPQDANGRASNGYDFVWNSRVGYTYS